MFIQEVVMEGFKSYATRTVISGWDPEFNAITGLNGSGKSNILDGICFLLGISSLSHVRANNLQDLVYKRGQAGISKASVTIVFNNEDRSKSPLGWEDHTTISITRQIIIGGRNKYIVNGHNKNQADVANLFQSVQLNVNNPHFLIMQGRITKVLNMKPPEILAMIEEAAGTRLFEDRKEKAFKVMEKKDTKLLEIQTLLDQEIGPKLDKLREAKRAFLEYQKMESELEFSSRLLVAFEYHQNDKLHSKTEASLQQNTNFASQIEANMQQWDVDLERIEVEKAELLAEMSENGGKCSELEQQFKEISKEHVKIQSQVDFKREAVEEEAKLKKSLLDSQVEAKDSLANSKKAYDILMASIKESRDEYQAKVVFIEKQQELLQTLTTGLSSSEGNDVGYADQLNSAKARYTQATTDIEKVRLKVKQAKNELKELQPKVKTAEKDASRIISEMANHRLRLEQMQQERDELKYDDGLEAELKKSRDGLRSQVAKLSENVTKASAGLGHLQFTFNDPSPNFDRSQVHGLVAQLLTLPENHSQASVALEICAGGKLYNVVVDSEVVGSLLLEKGGLVRRVTLIPLNKIQPYTVAPERISEAKSIAPGNVELAMNLIEYGQKVAPAMSYVFGSTLICKDAESAKQVTFNKKIQMRSVTFDGDVYDPSGQLSGGSKSSGSGVLVKLRALDSATRAWREKQQELDAVERHLNDLESRKVYWSSLVQKIDLKTHELTLLQAQADSNPASQVVAAFEKHQEQLISLQKSEEELLVVREKEQAAVGEIERDMKEFSNHRESKLSAISKGIADAKAIVAKAAPAQSKLEQKIEVSKKEISAIEREIALLEEQSAKSEESRGLYERELASLMAEAGQILMRCNEAEDLLKKERQGIAKYDKRLKALESEGKQKSGMKEDGKLELKKLALSHEKLLAQDKVATSVIKELELQNPWIQDQKVQFGQPKTSYDFSSVDIEDCRRRQAQLIERHTSLGRNLDHQVLDKFSSVEKQESLLSHKIATVQRDKKNIKETVASLDEYKRDALRQTWSKVDKDFGAIFGDLLPGNSAKLVPLEGKDISEGLEVKVCLGGVWKSSLTELSGGQRSLIALSLILSLLQFKPAPMYILDEVDSALDLSHTQNIGQLLRTRFKGSQFIIVSLKDGMFNNANVLFRTKFRDGVSTVERTCQVHEGHEDEGAAKRAAARRGLPASRRSFGIVA